MSRFARSHASWIPAAFALVVAVVVLGRWSLTLSGGARVAAVVLLAGLVPVAAIAGVVSAERPLRRRAAELEVRIEEAQDARRVHDEIYGRFINELRAPLTAVYGFSRHLEDAGISNVADAEELIGIISHDATEVVRKVENIATAAQIEAGIYRPKPKAVDLGHEVERVVNTLGHSQIRISIDAQPAIAWCDPAAIRQIVLNLIHIAGEATARTARIDVEERNGLAILSVTDDRLHQDDDDFVAGDLLGSTGSLSARMLPTLVEYQGATMNSARTLGWTNTVIRFPMATPAQRSEDFRPPRAVTTSERNE
jgi:two-component system, OmpR family, sensor kinase